MNCLNCGAKNADTANHCTYCGTAMTQPAAQPWQSAEQQPWQPTEPQPWQPTGQHPYEQQSYAVPQQETQQPPTKGFAAGSLACGIVAATIPVPIFDVIVGALGFLFYALSVKKGYSRGLATAGLILSIIGIIAALSFTLSHFGIISD